jgi:hypothetical protein
MIKGSDIFDTLVKVNYFGISDYSKISRNSRNVRAGLAKERQVDSDEESENEEDSEDATEAPQQQVIVPEVVNFKEGELPDANKYPFLHSFQIPVTNQAALDGLLSEIARYKKEHQGNGVLTHDQDS